MNCNHTSILNNKFCIDCSTTFIKSTNTQYIKHEKYNYKLEIDPEEILLNMQNIHNTNFSQVETQTQNSFSKTKDDLYPQKRKELLTVFKKISNQLSFKSQSIFLSIYYLDNIYIYLKKKQSKNIISEKNIYNYGLSSFILAVKFVEIDNTIPDLNIFVTLFKLALNKNNLIINLDTLKEKEIEILKIFGYNLKYFTLYDYFTYFYSHGIVTNHLINKYNLENEQNLIKKYLEKIYVKSRDFIDILTNNSEFCIKNNDLELFTSIIIIQKSIFISLEDLLDTKINNFNESNFIEEMCSIYKSNSKLVNFFKSKNDLDSPYNKLLNDIDEVLFHKKIKINNEYIKVKPIKNTVFTNSSTSSTKNNNYINNNHSSSSNSKNKNSNLVNNPSSTTNLKILSNDYAANLNKIKNCKSVEKISILSSTCRNSYNNIFDKTRNKEDLFYYKNLNNFQSNKPSMNMSSNNDNIFDSLLDMKKSISTIKMKGTMNNGFNFKKNNNNSNNVIKLKNNSIIKSINNYNYSSNSNLFKKNSSSSLSPKKGYELGQKKILGRNNNINYDNYYYKQSIDSINNKSFKNGVPKSNTIIINNFNINVNNVNGISGGISSSTTKLNEIGNRYKNLNIKNNCLSTKNFTLKNIVSVKAKNGGNFFNKGILSKINH